MKYLRDPKNNKPQIIVAPTASGKSVLIAEVARQWGKPVLVLQPSKELLEQNHGKVVDLGVKATVYSASAGTKELSEITYATIGSITSLAEEMKELGIEVVMVDECHFSYSPEPTSQFSKFMKELAPKKVIGFTATPFRLVSNMNGSELKLLNRMRPMFFKEFLHIIQIQEIIELGYWAKIKYEIHKFDESGLRVNSNGSEFTDESIKKAMEVQGVNNNVYKRIRSLVAEGCPSILVFVDALKTADKMNEALRSKGIKSAFLHAKLPKKDRDKIVKDFKTKKIQVVLNFGLLTTGFDYPDLRCVIMARPTMSLALYYQILGRGTRISPATGKDHFRFIDYCNNIERFGCVEHLVLRYVDGFGWGMFNNDILLTNTPMAGMKKRISDLNKPSVPILDQTIWFGKYSGHKITDLKISYIKWLLFESSFNYTVPKMRQLKKGLEEVLRSHETIKLLPIEFQSELPF